MHNYYLDLLRLQPGASKQEIKSAYRLLSKKYHPDVSKDPEAKEKFIRITEAYRFLTDVGPRPHGERKSYNYDPRADEFTRRRAKARYQARNEAKEAAKRYYHTAVRFTRIFSIPIATMIVYNLLAAVDRYVPTVVVNDQVIEVEHNVYEDDKIGIKKKYGHGFELVHTENFLVQVSKGKACDLSRDDVIGVRITPILHHPVGVHVKDGPNTYYYGAPDSAYKFYIFLIPLMLALGLTYFRSKTQNMKISVAVVMVMVFLFQWLAY